MKFSRKMCFKIILKVTKNQGFTLSIEDTFFKKEILTFSRDIWGNVYYVPEINLIS